MHTRRMSSRSSPHYLSPRNASIRMPRASRATRACSRTDRSEHLNTLDVGDSLADIRLCR
jgi:hypothetical protein